MLTETVLDRFRCVQGKAGGPFSYLQAVARGDQIDFRQGKALRVIFFGIFAALAFAFAYLVIPALIAPIRESGSAFVAAYMSGAILLILGFVAVGVLGLVSSIRRRQVFFRVDSTTGSLTIPQRGEESYVLPFEDIAFFLAHHRKGSDPDPGTHGLYAVMRDYTTYTLAQLTQEIMRDRLLVLGYTCDVLSLCLETQYEFLDEFLLDGWIDPGFRSASPGMLSEYARLDMDALLSRSKIVYDPKSPENANT